LLSTPRLCTPTRPQTNARSEGSIGSALEDEMALVDDIETFIGVHCDSFERTSLAVLNVHAELSEPAARDSMRTLVARAQLITKYRPRLTAAAAAGRMSLLTLLSEVALLFCAALDRGVLHCDPL
jgi:hypothetical protein